MTLNQGEIMRDFFVEKNENFGDHVTSQRVGEGKLLPNITRERSAQFLKRSKKKFASNVSSSYQKGFVHLFKP